MAESEIPYFPPVCVATAPEKTCEAFGLSLTCVPSFPQDVPFTNIAVNGHLLSTALLFCIGLYNFSKVNRQKCKAHSMTIQTSCYALITALCVFCRLNWGISYLLVFGALVHNFFEWFFFVQVSAWVQTKEDSNRIAYTSMCIGTGIFLSMATLEYSVLQFIGVEQVLEYSLSLSIYIYIVYIYVRLFISVRACFCRFFVAYSARALTYALKIRAGFWYDDRRCSGGCVHIWIHQQHHECRCK